MISAKAPVRSSRLDVNFVHHSWEGYALPDVLLAGQPGDGSFDAESEAAVRHRAVFSQIQVPIVIFDIQVLFVDSRNQPVVIVLSNRAADDFAEAGGGEQIEIQNNLFIVPVGFHIEGLGLLGIVRDKDGFVVHL